MAILHHLLLAASMLAMASSSVELGEAPSGPGHRFELIRLHDALRYDDHEYFMELPMGGDSRLYGLVDTGSDLIWTNNSQLINSPTSCPTDTSCDPGDEKQGGWGCCFCLRTFNKKYSDSARVTGFMGESTLISRGSSYTLNIGCAVKFGCHDKQDKGCKAYRGGAVKFGCHDKQDKACKAYRGGGIVGLGHGEHSLATQLWLHSFSYCLAKHNSFILLNDSSLTKMGKPNTTEFTSSGNGYEKADSRYYVNPKKIVLGSKKGVTEENVTNFPYACSKQAYKNGDGGMFIDSGASFTRLPQEVLHNVTEHVTKLMEKKPKQNDSPNNNRFSCYDRELPEDMPDMVLHFCNGAEMVIPVDNYMLQDREECCLVFEKPKRNDGIPHGMSILGNFQQQNMTMLFDIKEKKLLFMENKGCQAGEKKHAAV